MAGKGGGAWKVAYADFVTAMMAFFLVMWIVAQDTKGKEQIAHYFATPLGYMPIGERNPAKTGGALEAASSGNLPDSKAVSMGRGRTPHSDDKGDGRNSKLVSDWLHSEPLGHSRRDQPQQRIAQTGHHDTQHRKGYPQRDRAIRGA